MLLNTSKTLGVQKIMVYKTPPMGGWGGGGVGGGKPYLVRGLSVKYSLKAVISIYYKYFKAEA